ncbi:MAG: hypothetical protein QXH40_03950 [Candidatus Bathyarchaeia archaeon]
MKTNLYLLKVALALKLSGLGFNVGICHRCGKIFDRTEESETLCKECKTHQKY